MRISFALINSVFLCFLLTGCLWNQGHGPVPDDWFQLPEDGTGTHPGKMGEFIKQVEGLFAAHGKALDQLQNTQLPNSSEKGRHPADWTPWRLAIYSADFALTADGIFGALVGEGAASVQANWRPTAGNLGTQVRKFKKDTRSPLNGPSHLLIKGIASSEQVEAQLEPAIQAALSGGKITNESALRSTIHTASENFRSMSAALNQVAIQSETSSFIPSAYRLEISVDQDGQLTPLYGVGASVNFRFDWVINDTAPTTGVIGKAGQNLGGFVKAIIPDINAAVASVGLKRAGYALSSVRVGLTLNSSYEAGISTTSSTAIASIVFGDNDEEGGCYDPDGDGICDFQTQSMPLEQNDDGIRLVKAVTPAHLQFAALQSVEFVTGQTAQGPTLATYKIPHQKFRDGLKKAIGMTHFFIDRAANSASQKWELYELEAEFDLSLTGTVGLASLGAGGELELEFEKQK